MSQDISTAISRPGALDVLSHTRNVVDYHSDPSQEGRPLWYLLGGAGVALVSLILIGMLVYRTWLLHELPENRAYFGISFLFCFYVLGVFVFCYAYELFDMGRALKLTIVVSFVSVVMIFLVVAALSQISRIKSGVDVLGGGEAAGDGSALSWLGVLGGADAERRREGDLEARMRNGTAPLLIKCHGCGETFQPLPPKAECAYCGRAAISS